MARLYSLKTLAIALLSLPFLSCYRNFEYCEGTPWIKFGGSCYLFRSTSEGRVSYYEADDFCRSQGAQLVSIHSQEENDFLLKTMEEGRFGGRLWIGLNTLQGDEAPRWSDGSPVDYQKRVAKEYYVNEKCFIMFLSKKGWRPEHCALHYAPLCKRPADGTPTPAPPPTTTAAPEGYCPKHWIQFEQKCYRYFGAAETDRVQYKQARDACWALGKNHVLVSIHSMEEQAFLTKHLYELGTSAWIGMRQVTSDEIGHDLVFGWIDNSRTDFTFWAQGHPPPGTWKYCARLSYEGVGKGEWIADYCEIDKKGYICQTTTDTNLPAPDPEPSNCTSGFVEYRDSCYRYISEPKNQQEAEDTCKELDGHLVSVFDSFEQAFLYNFIGHKSSIWNGLTNIAGTSYLRWSDGQTFYYSNWADPKFQMSKTTESCVLMDNSNALKWNTSDCSTKLPFVCEITKEVPPTLPEVLGSCPSSESSWIDIGDEFCYHVPQTTNHFLSWNDASRYCITKGMKMLKVYSDHQSNSLIAYLWKEPRGVLLGLIRSFDKESFIWVDGSALNYTNWDFREPSSWSREKDCVAFSQFTGKWSPIGCGESGVTICQASKSVKRSR